MLDADDGSLPGVEMQAVASRRVAVYAMLRRRSDCVHRNRIARWLVPRCGVSAGEAEASITDQGVLAGGWNCVLGVFVWPDCRIATAGPEWGGSSRRI